MTSLTAKPPPDERAEPESRFDRTVDTLAREIAGLAPGPLAQLRRGALREAGSAAFWTLYVHNDLAALGGGEEGWATVMQGMAIMTPTGRSARKLPAHDRTRPPGRQLASGGDPDWWSGRGEGHPAFSELRLARLLNARGAVRRDLALRACRMLASREARIDWRQMARLILYANEETTRRIAHDFYAALDRKRQETDRAESAA
ncbi:type I-E CRISPR-associated protein Cse2/CasB [Kaustia mangrovi]|uniref:Type I-E CRISPR-associated protein Cse2/CasB n=1 Tax=Kaustia mangrovi TaxID=2593653 RepID=A0A7S8HDY6_9HYPH|nr:type I-E CRISPR-associated protein Cse2/CasB [Kaustia mangrovi]QPC44969.1 type I-E CRISPR-associated protein Cse2/CasB [Kaustia mangrovi]